MENERRLVHLRARGCCIKKHRRRGCPQSIKPKLTIDGIRYEQVPAYFFVNYECRHVALKHYCIRFSVHCRAVNPVYSPQMETNIIMSPNDILVSWYTEALLVSSFQSYFLILAICPSTKVPFWSEACIWGSPKELVGYTQDGVY